MALYVCILRVAPAHQPIHVVFCGEAVNYRGLLWFFDCLEFNVAILDDRNWLVKALLCVKSYQKLPVAHRMER